MQAYQSAPCLYCGATWNPPGAQTCAKCHNPLPTAQAGYPVAFATPQPAAAAAPNRGFYRSPLRTFVFAAVGSEAYLVWWAFQLLGFAQRERFPKSGSPWWVLFPIIDLIYISRAFKGTAEAEKTALGKTSLPLPVINLGFILALVLSRVTANVYGTTGFVIDLVIALIFAGVLALVQRSANLYQASAHPELGPPPTGMAGRFTWGEIVALIVGGIMTLLLFSGDLLPS
jgi:hypothetical protein